MRCGKVRSILFVPGDSERKLARAAGAGADALALDLEDSVLAEHKPTARRLVSDFIQNATERGRLWVRVNALSSGYLLDDLKSIVAARPFGIVLPKIRGPEDITCAVHYLEALESALGVAAGSIAILALITETASSVLRIADFAREPLSPRVVAFAWTAEDLSSAMGGGEPRDADGAWRPVFAHARSQCLLAAQACNVTPVDTIYVDFKDASGLKRSCEASRADGFSARFAIHPDQVPIINEAFAPSEADRVRAQRLVAAFASGAGTISLDGKMYDIPHLRAAERLLNLGSD
jgi:citrate lyase subunit beta/citryl-CoA lyase